MNGVGNEKKEYYEYGILTVLSVLVFLALAGMLTGKGLFDENVYNSYALQAESWCRGRLDLPENYSWLELAVYEGRYYVSFPPFPSYVLLPFAFFFGSRTPDFLLLYLMNGISAVYLYRLCGKRGIPAAWAMFETLFVMLASNYVFCMMDPSVWFFAQTMCFMLSVLAVYFGLEGKGGRALFFLVCSAGCRPMQGVFLPVLFLLLLKSRKEEIREKGRLRLSLLSLLNLLKRRWYRGIPAFLIGLSYLLLNYARFGNGFEFGHNYLPEFVEAEYGQFHPHYIKNNLNMLFHLPEFTEDGKMIIDSFGNLSMLIVSPVFLIFLCAVIWLLLRREYGMLLEAGCIFLCAVVYMTIVVMHRTMGGWHFGNRYSNDLLPWICLPVLAAGGKYPRLLKYQIPFFIWGMCLNLTGSAAVYNGWV